VRYTHTTIELIIARIVESCAALVLMDAYMAQQARVGTRDVIVAAQNHLKRQKGATAATAGNGQ
jgi:hypothetical protein